jgi:hypothetical protein
MSTSVKLAEEDKKKLDKLQALVTLRSGRKLTQQELLSALIKDALAKSDEFAEVISGLKLPMNDEEFSRVRALASDWGVETRSEEIDEILYGPRKRKAA